MKKIILTGGGTAGHVTPNLALIPKLINAGYDIEYIGSYNGIEKELVSNCNIAYHGIASGKLRRYFSLKNFSDPFRVLKGYSEAKKLIKTIKPDVLFSKGGFVSVPVVYAAAKQHVPVIIHESDMTPGLANKLASKMATYVCCNFPETVKYLPEGKGICTGSPIRSNLLLGNPNKGHEFTKIPSGKPVLLVIGGSLGAGAINTALREALDDLLPSYNIVHICGKGKMDERLAGLEGYVQYEYISNELPDVFAMADFVLSRAGANSICEFLALKKPMLLVPLSSKASRGDQILNAKSFKKQGFAEVLYEEDLNKESLVNALKKVYLHKEDYQDAMANSNSSNAVDQIMDLINKLS